MITIILAILYLVLSYWVAVQARNTRAGFLGTFLLSLIVTPIVSFVFLYAFSEEDINFREVMPRKQAATTVENTVQTPND